MRHALPRTEAALVRRAAECSSAAFERLLGDHKSRLRLAISRHADNRADREDLEAETIAVLLEDRKAPLRRWQPTAPFAAYLITIAVRQCAAWHRRQERARMRRVPQLAAPTEAGDPAEVISSLVAAPSEMEPEAQVLRRETEEWIREGMAQLSDRDQLLLRLRYLEGLAGPEIGRTLGLTANNANVAIFRALRRLERILDADGQGLWDGSSA